MPLMFLTLFVLVFIHDRSFYSMTAIWPVSKFIVPSFWLNLILNISREKFQFNHCIFGVLHSFWPFLPPVCFTKIPIFVIHWFQDVHTVVYLYSLWAQNSSFISLFQASFQKLHWYDFLHLIKPHFLLSLYAFLFCCCYNCHPCLENLKTIAGFSNITLHV